MDKVNSRKLSMTESSETLLHDSGKLKNHAVSASVNGDMKAIHTNDVAAVERTKKQPKRIVRFPFLRSASSPAMVVHTKRKDSVAANDRMKEKQVERVREDNKGEWELEHRHVSFDECVHVLTKCSVVTMPLKNSTRLPSNNLVDDKEDSYKNTRASLKSHLKQTEPKHVSFGWEESLRMAVHDHDVSALGRLCQHYDVNFNIKLSNGLTLLHVASIEGCFRIVQYILKHGGMADDTDDNGWTALHYAALHGNVPCALALLRGGADMHAKTQEYYTAIELANDDEMILLLGRMMYVGSPKPSQNKETYV